MDCTTKRVGAHRGDSRRINSQIRIRFHLYLPSLYRRPILPSHTFPLHRFSPTTAQSTFDIEYYTWTCIWVRKMRSYPLSHSKLFKYFQKDPIVYYKFH